MLDSFKNKLLFACAIVFLVTLFFVVVFDDNKGIKKEKPIVDKNKIITLFDNIKDNYTLSIEENNNNEILNYTYQTDGKLELYDKNDLENGYIKYKDNLFLIDGDNYKIKKIDKLDFVSSEYYNINFIKDIVSKCDFEYISSGKVSCDLKRSTYYEEYNKYYNSEYGNDSEDVINITLNYNDNISNIKFDFSYNSNIKIYNIEIKNIDKNDFNEFYEYYKKELE